MRRNPFRLGDSRQTGRFLVFAIRSRSGIRRSGGNIPVQRQNDPFVNPVTSDRLVVEQLLLDGILPVRQRFGRSGRATVLRRLRSFGTSAGRYLGDRFRHVTGRCRRDFLLRMPFPGGSEPYVAGRLLLRTLRRRVRTRPSGRRNGCLSLRAGMRLGDLASGKRLRKQNRFIQSPELFQHQSPVREFRPVRPRSSFLSGREGAPRRRSVSVSSIDTPSNSYQSVSVPPPKRDARSPRARRIRQRPKYTNKIFSKLEFIRD